MKLYSIRRWDELFENNRSRTVSDLSWVKIPNRHDGENYSTIITHKKGAEIFAAWILIVQVASRCQPRGTLLRDNKKPHTPLSLSIKTRAPKDWFELALDFLEKETDWLDIQHVAGECQETVRQVTCDCQAGDEERTEEKEQNRTEQKGVFLDDCKLILNFLNEHTGSHFRETESSLGPIKARLKESGVEIESVKKMILRQVKLWKGTKFEEYLRPSTLFGKEKFNEYYAARDKPTNTFSGGNTSNPRNEGVCRTGPDYGEIAAEKLRRQNAERLPGI